MLLRENQPFTSVSEVSKCQSIQSHRVPFEGVICGVTAEAEVLGKGDVTMEVEFGLT